MTTTPDPVTAEILRHILLAIPKRIDTNITHTAYSPLVYEYKDFAAGLVDADGKLICQGGGGAPLFAANALGAAIKDGLALHGAARMRPGDICFTNHAATLGQHLNNIVMYAPAHAGEGQELIGFMVVLMHWIDVGGARVGSVTPDATEIFHEGIQYRHLRLWSEGRRNEEVYRTIEANTRFPMELMGDVDAQVGACILGRDMLCEVAAKYGTQALRTAIDRLWERSEAMARNVVRKIPDGIYSAATWLDDDGIDLSRPVPIRVSVSVAGDELSVDFSNTAAQVRAPINSGREGGAIACARIAFKYLATPDEPANDGAFRPLQITIPEGTLISASADAPMGMYSTILPTVVDTIIKAMVPAVPERTAAGHHATFHGLVFAGTDPATGRRFSNVDSNHGGWGATSDQDGAGPFKTMIHGDTLGVPIELQESLYPIRIESCAIRPDSGGPGRFRGGNGIDKRVRVLADCDVLVTIERTTHPAWGVNGGLDGKPPEVYIERPGEPPRKIAKGWHALRAGDGLRLLTAGGGGYGNPRERDPALIARDLRDEVISIEAAERHYGYRK